MSFVSAFNQYYKDNLKPYGFIKLKGIPYFGRIINNEILHTISFHPMHSMIKGKKAFALNFSVLSLYSSNLTSEYLSFASVCLVELCRPDEDNFQKDFDNYYALHYDNHSIPAVLEKSFKQVQDKLLPYINTINTLEKYVEHCKLMKIALIRKDFNNYRDLYVLVKINNHEDLSDLVERYQKRLSENPNMNPNHDYSDNIKEYQTMLYQKIVRPRDEIYASPTLLLQTMTELDKRKFHNTKMLKNYGFMI